MECGVTWSSITYQEKFGPNVFTEGTVLKDLFEIKLSKSTRVGCKLSLSTWDRATEGEEAHSWTAFLGIGACRRTESLRP